MAPPPRVLVIDDDAATRELVELLLGDEGYAVLAAPAARTRPGLRRRLPLPPQRRGPPGLHDCGRGPALPGIAAEATLAKPFDLGDLLAAVDRLCP